MVHQQSKYGISLPEFRKVLDICVDDEIIQQFTPLQATEKTLSQLRSIVFPIKKDYPKITAAMVVDLFLIAVVF
jgi:hypothetical protein